MSNSIGPGQQSLPAHLSNASQSSSLDSSSESGSLDKTEGKAFNRKASRVDSVERKLQNLKAKRNKRSGNKALPDFRVKQVRPNPRFNLARVHAQPGLQVWSNNPQAVQVRHYQGPPIGLPQLQNLGPVTLLPPGNWQIGPQGAITPFPLPLPSPLFPNPPGGIVQHFTGHPPQQAQLQPPRAAPAPQPPAQEKPAAAVTSAYKNHELRELINKSRVSERFHDVKQSSDRWRNKAASVTEAFEKGTSRHTKVVAELKTKHLTQLASVLDHHQSEQLKSIPATSEEIKAQAQSQIDALEEGMQIIAEISNSGKAYYSQEDFAALKELNREMDAERALLVKVMDDPDNILLGGDVSWNEATELKRLGYSSSTAIVGEFTTLKDEELIKPAEHFGAGKQHSVQKLTFAGETENDPPREYLFKADDAKDASQYEKLVGADQYLDKSKPGFAGRNIGAQRLQNLLDVDLIPPMKLTTHDGKLGLLMNKAEGVQPFDSETKKPVDLPYDSLEKPSVSANIQKNLMDAQWLDCLTGQQDRHSTNLFINPENGKVTLIDNDQAFYPGLQKVSDPEPDRKIGSWTPPWPGKPELIDRHTFEKLQALEDDQVKESLDPFLTKKEIESTLLRLKDLKEHALELEKKGMVVDDWTTWRSPDTDDGKGGKRVADFLHSTGKPQSYFNALSKLGGHQPAPIPKEAKSI